MKLFSALCRLVLIGFFAFSVRVAAQSNAPVFYNLSVKPSIDVAPTAPYHYGQLGWKVTDETGALVAQTQALFGSANTTMTMSYTGPAWTGGNFVPFKEYTFTVTLILGTTGHVGFTLDAAHAGAVFINGVQQTSFDCAYPGTSGPQYKDFVFKLRIGLPSNFVPDLEPSYLPAGTASSITPDKPVWYVGLGRMRNGNPAGVVGFRQQTFTSIFTPACLYYASYYPNIDGEVDQVNSAGILRQVLSREVLVDIITVSSTSYRLDIYSRKDNSVSQSAPGAVCTFSGSPFVSYTVSQIAGGVDITRTEDGVTWDTSLTNSGSTWTFTDWHVPSTLTSTLTTTYSSNTAATMTQTGPSSGLSGTVPGYVDTPLSWTKTLGLNGTSQYVVTNMTYGAGGTTPLSTNYTYYTATDAPSGAYLNSLKWVVNADGTYSGYTYYVGSGPNDATVPDGQINTIFHPWLDAAPVATASPTTCAYDQYNYTLVQKGMSSGILPTAVIWMPSSIASYAPNGSLPGTLLKKSTFSYATNLNPAGVNGRYLWSQTEHDYSDSSNFVSITTKFIVPAATPSYLDDMVYSVAYPSGKMDSYAYFNGTWNSTTNLFTASASGSDRLVLCFHGRVSGGINPVTVSSWSNNGVTWTMDPVAMESIRSSVSESVTDASGRLVFSGEDVFASAGTITRVSGTQTTYDSHGRLTTTIDIMRSLAGHSYQSQRQYTSGLLNQATAPDGIVTSYTYDGLLRQTQVTTGVGGPSLYPAVTRTTVFDGANRVVSASGTNGTAATVYYYDTAGRVSKTAAPSPNSGSYLVTSYSYDSVNSTTTTLPTGATTTRTTYGDGRTKGVSGTAQPPSYMAYSANTSPLGLQTNVYNATSADQSQGWTTTQYDLLGRVVSQTAPTYGWTTTNNQAVKVTSTYESTTGLLRSQQSTSVATGAALTPAHLYIYNGAGRLVQDGLDLDGNNSLDASGNDRYLLHDSYFQLDAVGWRTLQVNFTQATLNSGTLTQISSVATRLTNFNSGVLGTNGLVIAEVDTGDANGQTVVQTESVDVATLRHHVETTLPGTSNVSYSETKNGYAYLSQTGSGARAEEEYDSEGRLSTTHSRWNGTTYAVSDTTAYFGDTGYVASQTSSGITVNSSYAWDSAHGTSQVTTTDAAGHTSYTLYNAMGQAYHIGGTATSAVQYGYDGLGRLTSQTTWTTGNYNESTWPSSGGAATTWTIEAATGLGTRKTFADGNHVDFTYTALGQPLVRTSARRVTATYAYYDGSTTVATDVSHRTQELRSVSYSDGTAGLSYTYNRSGVPATVSDATGSRIFNYDGSQPMRVTSEALSTFYNSRVETQQYDAVYRPAGFELGTSSTPAADLNQAIAYNAASGLPSTLTNTPKGGTARSFTYGYEATGLYAGYSTAVSGGNYSQSYAYQTGTNLRANSVASFGSTVLSEYDLGYNNLGQVQSTRQSGAVFSDYYTSSYTSIINAYNYDAMGQLQTTAAYRGSTPITAPASGDELPGHRFEFRYDAMGNRTSSGETGGAADDTYTTNALNQYSAKTNYTARILGTVANLTGVNVAVAGATSTGKLDRAWGADIVPNQGTSSVQAVATVYAAKPGGAGADLVRIDTSKSYFLPPRAQSFIYDADGNLTDDQVWTYGYDAENRLISMTSKLPAGFGLTRWNLTFKYDYLGRRVEKAVVNPDNGFANYTRRFLYNGWNLVAELDSTGTNLVRSYAWGLDLAGSFTVTGGVAALLEMTDYTASKNYFAAYDHNGNVAALEREDGTLAAIYEYSPFGESLRVEAPDPAVANNPFRFSTKYTDVETGLSYYGLRYYNPILGRFINRDPAEESGGINLYGFCGNNAVSRTDSLGRWTTENIPDTQEGRDYLYKLQMTLQEEYGWGHASGGHGDALGFDTADSLMYGGHQSGDENYVSDGLQRINDVSTYYAQHPTNNNASATSGAPTKILSKTNNGDDSITYHTTTGDYIVTQPNNSNFNPIGLTLLSAPNSAGNYSVTAGPWMSAETGDTVGSSATTWNSDGTVDTVSWAAPNNATSSDGNSSPPEFWKSSADFANATIASKENDAAWAAKTASPIAGIVAGFQQKSAALKLGAQIGEAAPYVAAGTIALPTIVAGAGSAYTAAQAAARPISIVVKVALIAKGVDPSNTTTTALRYLQYAWYQGQQAIAQVISAPVAPPPAGGPPIP